MLSRLLSRRRRGLSLFGSLMALAVLAVLVVGLSQWMQDRLQEGREERAAHQLAVLAEAARAFALDDFPALVTGAADREITLAQLQAADLLPAAFTARDAMGRGWRVFLHRPAAGVLEVLATQTVAAGDDRWPWRGPASAPAGEMRMGTVPPGAPATLRGPTVDVSVAPFQAAWSDPPARAMAAWTRLDRQSVYGNQLYRVAAAGFPEINRMETDLDMAGNDIVDAGAIEAATLELTAGLQVGQDLTVTGDLLVGASLEVTGEAAVGGALTATSAAVAGAASAASVTAAGALSGASLSVTGDVDAATIGASGAMTVAGPATMDDLTASTVSASSATASSLTVSDASVQQLVASGSMTAASAGVTTLTVGSCSGC